MLNYVPDTNKCWEYKIKEDIIIILKNFTLDLWFFKNTVCLVKIKFSAAKYEISKQIKKNLCYLTVIRYQDLYLKKTCAQMLLSNKHPGRNDVNHDKIPGLKDQTAESKRFLSVKKGNT